MAQKLIYSKIKKVQRVSPKDTKKKDTRSKLLLKGSDRNDYVISIEDGKLYFDLALKKEELYELYLLLERKYGEFQGYNIK